MDDESPVPYTLDSIRDAAIGGAQVHEYRITVVHRNGRNQYMVWRVLGDRMPKAIPITTMKAWLVDAKGSDTIDDVLLVNKKAYHIAGTVYQIWD